MSQTVQQIVAAVATSDKCSVVSMRSPKQNFDEIINEFSKSTENDFQTLQGPTNDGARILIVIVDRMDSGCGSGFATVERRI